MQKTYGNIFLGPFLGHLRDFSQGCALSWEDVSPDTFQSFHG